MLTILYMLSINGRSTILQNKYAELYDLSEILFVSELRPTRIMLCIWYSPHSQGMCIGYGAV